MSELAWVVLDGRDLKYTRLWPGHAGHAVQRHSQVVGIERPNEFRFWCSRIRDCHGHHAARDRLNGPAFALAVRQVQDQPVAGLGLGISVERDSAAIHRSNATANWPARQQLVSDGDDVAGQRNATIKTDLKGDYAILGVGEERPFAAALSLRLSRAADRTDLQRVVAITALKLGVGHGGDIGVVVVRRVVVADQGPTVTGAFRCARVGELAVDHVRPGVGEIEIGGAGHVGQREDLALGPVSHAAIDRRDIAQQRPGISLALQVQVADEAWLLATLPVRHHLIAVLGDPVQLPFVDHPRLDTAAQTKAVGSRDVVGHPSRVIGPRLLESAIPNPGV